MWLCFCFVTPEIYFIFQLVLNIITRLFCLILFRWVLHYSHSDTALQNTGPSNMSKLSRKLWTYWPSSCFTWSRSSKASRTTPADFYKWQAWRNFPTTHCMSSAHCEARFPGDGPQGTFAEIEEWVLMNCGSSYTICPAEEAVTIPTPDPEPIQPPPTHCTE